MDDHSPLHESAARWLEKVLNGSRRVGFPWGVLGAFLRIGTHPRAFDYPLGPEEAWSHVDEWLGRDVAWIPEPTHRHADVLRTLIFRHQLRGNLVSDAHLAALAIEHGVAVCSADADFARFREIEWVNPVAPASR